MPAGTPIVFATGNPDVTFRFGARFAGTREPGVPSLKFHCTNVLFCPTGWVWPCAAPVQRPITTTARARGKRYRWRGESVRGAKDEYIGAFSGSTIPLDWVTPLSRGDVKSGVGKGLDTAPLR